MGVSAKTAIKQAVNNGRYKKEAWQYREFGSTHGIVLGFFLGGGGGESSQGSNVDQSSRFLQLATGSLSGLWCHRSVVVFK